MCNVPIYLCVLITDEKKGRYLYWLNTFFAENKKYFSKIIVKKEIYI